MASSSESIRQAIRALGLVGRPLGVHCSLSSFGALEGGAVAIVAGLLAEGCTLLAPTFSTDAFSVPPPPDQQPERNGWRYDGASQTPGNDRMYRSEDDDVDPNMGALPAAVLATPGRRRGRHPLSSFSAVGPLAEELIDGQTPQDMLAPLRKLVELDGAAICMGVGLNRLTLLHLAEEQAGRQPFRRWANSPQGRPMMVAVGGCSAGFARFDAVLAPAERRISVGESLWRVFPARECLRRAQEAIRSNPAITRCADHFCVRCEDAIAGGPLPLA